MPPTYIQGTEDVRRGAKAIAVEHERAGSMVTHRDELSVLISQFLPGRNQAKNKIKEKERSLCG